MIVPDRAAAPVDVGLHYDELDWLYREVWGEHVHHGLWPRGNESTHTAVRELVALVARRGGIRRGSSVCDVGCGYGGTARLLGREFGARVTGVTVSRAQFDYARMRSDGNWPRYLLTDWLEARLPDGTFDAVLAIESTEHMSDKLRCLKQARRVLRDGGRVVVAVWLSAAKARRWETRHLLRPICSEGRLCGLGTQKDYFELFERSDLRVVQFEDLSEKVKRTWSICIARVFKGLATDTRFRRFLLDRGKHNREFALTLFRIWLAYRTGAMRYGLFTAVKSAT